MLQPKHRQQMPQASAEVDPTAQRRRVAITARHMVIQELDYKVFVKLLNRQLAARHPVCKVRHRMQVRLDATGRVATSLQPCRIGAECGRHGPSSSQALAKGRNDWVSSMVISSCEITIPAPTPSLCPVQQHRSHQEGRKVVALRPAARLNCS
jgi:hypothetical protein